MLNATAQIIRAKRCQTVHGEDKFTILAAFPRGRKGCNIDVKIVGLQRDACELCFKKLLPLEFQEIMMLYVSLFARDMRKAR